LTQVKDIRKPIRSCIACRQKADKRTLVRIVRTPEGTVLVDETGRRAGRGAYICAVGACFEKARKGRLLDRALRVKLAAHDYTCLEEAFVGIDRGSADAKASEV
jgi:predicted RNA-binding protein YlxR (DUF448 family)